MNRILCIMKDMESGITLMKDKNDTKNWTERDLLRMKKKNLVCGYDAAYAKQFVVFDTSEIQYMYLVESENWQANKVGTEQVLDAEEDGESKKWSGAAPQPTWGDPDNGVMFQ